MQKLFACVLAAMLAAACTPARPEYSGNLRVAAPQLIAINPDVKVVADADKPMFFAAGAYWLFHDGQWYRAPALRGRYTLVLDPPGAVKRIDQPYAYTHYQRDLPRETEPATPEDQQPQQTASRKSRNPLMQFAE